MSLRSALALWSGAHGSAATKTQSIRRGLIAALVGLQAVTVLIILALSRLTNEPVLIKHAENILKNAANESIEHTRGFLEPAHRVASVSAEILSTQTISATNEQAIEKYFVSLLENNPEIAGVYIGTLRGEFTYVSRNTEIPGAAYRTKIIRYAKGVRHTRLWWRDDVFHLLDKREDPDDSYEPRSRPWFKESLKVGAPLWTEPYVFFTSKKPGITIAVPYESSSGAIAGVLGVDIELTELSDFIAGLHIGTMGTAFIIDRDGRLVAQPASNKSRGDGSSAAITKLAPSEDANDPVIRNAVAAYRVSDATQGGGPDATINFEVNGRHHIAVFKQLSLPGGQQWLICAQAPQLDFLGTIRASERRNILIACGVLLLSMLIGWVLATRTWRPVEDLRDRAVTDHLTGVFNRHYMFDMANFLFARAKTTNSPLTVAMIDIDHFKDINDSHGHGIGDEVLKAISSRLKHSLRDKDVMGRYGGEEFIVLLPDTDIESASSIMQRVHADISTGYYRIGEHVLGITASVGLAAMQNADNDPPTLIEAADKALYEAKRLGRNRVETRGVS